ncbi:cupin domain-containing protein [Microbacterium yannicii]|uniref:cupin domain-containing protein n=1 Tax=Microbacterium yannicii TaxID=671622 RepID=UPI00192AFB8D|nr:cupin domain-containing protein [Microbacterium yannicii]
MATTGLGGKIRAARTARGLSLRTVAAAINLSPSLLSQVETGKIQPSVSTLYAIVTYLDLSIDELLDRGAPASESDPGPRGPEHPVQRSGTHPLVTMQNGVTWERLATLGPTDRIDPILTTYAPRGASSIEDSHMRHSGVEYGYVITGELTLKLDFESYVLHAGDSVCFDSRRPHLYVNHTDQVTQGVWFVVGRNEEGDATEPGGHINARTAVDALEILRSTRTEGGG